MDGRIKNLEMPQIPLMKVIADWNWDSKTENYSIEEQMLDKLRFKCTFTRRSRLNISRTVDPGN